MIEVDESGWAKGAVTPIAEGRAFLLLSPEADGRFDAARWAHQAKTFFATALSFVNEKRYPTGAVPIADAAEVSVAPLRGGEATVVRVVTMPLDRAPWARRAGIVGAQNLGGAGFDVLVTRGKRLWQVDAAIAQGADARAPLLVSAVIASVFLAPIVPPSGDTIFGVKGARERLEKQGLRV